MIRRRRVWSPILASIVLATALAAVPAPTGAVSNQALFESYNLTGYEIWYAPTVGRFAGTGTGSTGPLSAWYASIEHSGVISPAGTVNGGWAVLQRLDGVRVSGWFAGGTVWLLNDGPGCTDETHLVRAALDGVTRGDGAASGSGYLEATLVHHRAWLFGRCYSYSATINGTLSLIF
jgi:hypothetical protein